MNFNCCKKKLTVIKIYCDTLDNTDIIYNEDEITHFHLLICSSNVLYSLSSIHHYTSLLQPSKMTSSQLAC